MLADVGLFSFRHEPLSFCSNHRFKSFTEALTSLGLVSRRATTTANCVSMVRSRWSASRIEVSTDVLDVAYGDSAAISVRTSSSVGRLSIARCVSTIALEIHAAHKTKTEAATPPTALMDQLKSRGSKSCAFAFVLAVDAVAATPTPPSTKTPAASLKLAGPKKDDRLPVNYLRFVQLQPWRLHCLAVRRLDTLAGRFQTNLAGAVVTATVLPTGPRLANARRPQRPRASALDAKIAAITNTTTKNKDFLSIFSPLSPRS